MGFDARTILPPQRRPAIQLLGNAVCPPVAAAVIRAIREAA
jgi:site-specific DNA-cytosine methylase